MENRLFFICLIVLLYLNSYLKAQLPPGYGFGLVNPSATCTSYIGDSDNQKLCNNRLPENKKIYTENSTSQYFSQEKIIKSFKSLTFLQDECQDLLFIQFGLCDLYLAPCFETIPMMTPIKTVSLPKRICKSACDRMVKGCPALGVNMNCSNPLIFPEKATLYNLTDYGFPAAINMGLYPVNCTDPTEQYNLESSNTELIEICPSPLLLKNSSDPKYYAERGYNYLPPTNCVLPCPLPNYTKTKWEELIHMSEILSTISFVLSLYNVITFGILNKKVTDPHKCICFFSGSIAMVNLADIITYGVGYNEVLCPDPGRFSNQSDDPVCGFTGSLFHLGITYCVMWSMSMGVVLYSSVKRLNLFNFKYYLIFNTGWTILSLIIALSSKKIVANTIGIECWMIDRWFTIGLFWIPCAVALLIGSSGIFGVIHEIYIVTKNSNNVKKDLFQREFKLFLIVVFVAGSFLYLFIVYFDIDRHKDYFKSKIEDYVLCLLNGEGECYTTGPSYISYFLFYLVIRWFGIVFFMAFGTSAAARYMWINSDFFVIKKIKSISLKTISKNSNRSENSINKPDRLGSDNTSNNKSEKSLSDSNISIISDKNQQDKNSEIES